MAIAGMYDLFNEKWCKQTIWLISDTHFGDEDLRAGIPDRISDDEIVKRINAKVGRKDTIIHLGDVGDVEYIKKLRGYKILICGNHDAGATNYEGIFDEVYTGPLMVGEKLLLSHEPVDIPWAFNIHGHDHAGTGRKNHLNCCIDAHKKQFGLEWEPINMNQIMKTGLLSKTESIHRITIDDATERKNKRGKKLGRSNCSH
jgi:calcineurin-like phosphoesterase family protein